MGFKSGMSSLYVMKLKQKRPLTTSTPSSVRGTQVAEGGGHNLTSETCSTCDRGPSLRRLAAFRLSSSNFIMLKATFSVSSRCARVVTRKRFPISGQISQQARSHSTWTAPTSYDLVPMVIEQSVRCNAMNYSANDSSKPCREEESAHSTFSPAF